MRKYEPIWNQLKQAGVAKVKVAPALQRKVIIAVRNEKYRDFGFKLVCAEKNMRLRLKEVVQGDIITFHLIDRSPISPDKL